MAALEKDLGVSENQFYRSGGFREGLICDFFGIIRRLKFSTEYLEHRTIFWNVHCDVATLKRDLRVSENEFLRACGLRDGPILDFSAHSKA